MDEGRGIYSVAMFHKKQDTPRVPCFFPRWAVGKVSEFFTNGTCFLCRDMLPS